MPASGSPVRYLRQASKKVSRTCSRVGSNILRLAPEFAKIPDQAPGTLGLARHAHVASVQDQPVVRVLQEFLGGEFEKLHFHFEWILARRDSRSIRYAEDVRIDRHRQLAERSIEHDIRRLPPDTGQVFQVFPGLGHCAGMFLKKNL